MSFTVCEHCNGPKGVCERCGYVRCERCTPCPCQTGKGSALALRSQVRYDLEHGKRPGDKYALSDGGSQGSEGTPS